MSSLVTPEEVCNLSAAALTIYPTGVVPEQHWLQQGQYHSGNHSLPEQQDFPAHVSDLYNTNGLIIEHADMQPLERRQDSPIFPLSHFIFQLWNNSHGYATYYICAVLPNGR